MKNIKDYIHHYLGCDCDFFIGLPEGFTAIGERTIINTRVLHNVINDLANVKPILRPLSDMTDEEIRMMFVLKGYNNENFKPTRVKIDDLFIQFEIDGDEYEYQCDYQHLITMRPNQFTYLLKQGFDLFGLIDAGLALDKTKL